MSGCLSELCTEILKQRNPQQAAILQKFFKTGKGEYGEGDIFYGIKVPVQRKIAKRFKDLSLSEIRTLLSSKIHEERLIASLILVEKFSKADEEERKKLFYFYMKYRKWINNWDIVDLTAPKIVGRYLLNSEKKVLYSLAKSKNLWERRIAVISTFEFIRNNQFEDVLKISELLLNDKHDLIHKAVGWMLREVGKRNFQVEENFLISNYKKMPRTMLRYAIEKFPEKKRKKFLEGKI